MDVDNVCDTSIHTLLPHAYAETETQSQQRNLSISMYLIEYPILWNTKNFVIQSRTEKSLQSRTEPLGNFTKYLGQNLKPAKLCKAQRANIIYFHVGMRFATHEEWKLTMI